MVAIYRILWILFKHFQMILARNSDFKNVPNYLQEGKAIFDGPYVNLR